MQPVDIQAETSCFIDQSLLKNANKFNAASKKLNCLQLMVLRLNIFFCLHTGRLPACTHV